jgi:glycosyltransferase involved in cell wall biosynthesis
MNVRNRRSIRFNQAHLAKAISGVLEQTLPDFELIVVDDGSRMKL